MIKINIKQEKEAVLFQHSRNHKILSPLKSTCLAELNISVLLGFYGTSTRTVISSRVHVLLLDSQNKRL